MLQGKGQPVLTLRVSFNVLSLAVCYNITSNSCRCTCCILDHFLCQFVLVIISDQKHAKQCVVTGLKSGGHINYLLYVLVKKNVPLL